MDKHTQVRQMGEIYSAAQITLVAAAGSDPSYGLPGVLSRPRLIPEAEEIQNMCLKPLPRFVQLAEVAESRWASRAWTFQEFYHSTRRLIFTENQIIFVCNNHIRCEVDLSGIHWPRSDELPTEDGYWAQRWLPQHGLAGDQGSSWTAIDRAAGHLQAYSNRDLTYDSDSLDAISGALHSLRKDSINHTWGAPFRHAAAYAADSLSARLRHYNLTYSIRDRGSFVSIGSRRSTNTDDNDVERVHVSASQDFQSMNYPSIPQKGDKCSVLGHGQQIEMALAWYHQEPARRRCGFPSWSSIGWEGPLSWSRWACNIDREEPPIVLIQVRKARLHFPKFSCDLSKFDPALQEDVDPAPPTLEFTARTAKLDLVSKRYPEGCPDRFQVALEINDHYKYAFGLHWDADPASLSSKQLVGALLDGRTEHSKELEGYLMVLAPYGDVLERVGLVHLPSIAKRLYNNHMLGQDLLPLAGHTGREAEHVALTGYPWERRTWWQSSFSDYRPVVIG